MELSTMTIAEHEAEISRLQDSKRPIDAQMAVVHASMEAKIRATPILATGSDQVLKPGGDLIGWLKSLPPDALAKAKEFFTSGGN